MIEYEFKPTTTITIDRAECVDCGEEFLLADRSPYASRCTECWGDSPSLIDDVVSSIPLMEFGPQSAGTWGED